MVPAVRVFSVLALLVFLAACGESTSPEPASTTPVEDSFQATLRVADGGERSLSGDVAADFEGDLDQFRGSFGTYEIDADVFGRPVFFTVITLRDADGDVLRLGRVRPANEPETGVFGIEAGRDLRPPFGYVAAFQAAGVGAGRAAVMATAGTVEITLDGKTAQGTFALTMSDRSTLNGTFTVPRG